QLDTRLQERRSCSHLDRRQHQFQARPNELDGSAGFAAILRQYAHEWPWLWKTGRKRRLRRHDRSTQDQFPRQRRRKISDRTHLVVEDTDEHGTYGESCLGAWLRFTCELLAAVGFYIVCTNQDRYSRSTAQQRHARAVAKSHRTLPYNHWESEWLC